MIRIKHRGDFWYTERFLRNAKNVSFDEILRRYGQLGVDALTKATPKDTGKTASSWSFEVNRTASGASIIWSNSNVNKGVNIAVILQYGHGTGGGGWVEGIDYINPALQSVFRGIADDAWREVTRA